MHAGRREAETKRLPVQRSLRQIADANDEMIDAAGHGISGCCGPTVTDAIAADPGIGKGKSKEKQKHEEALGKSEEANFAKHAGVIFHEWSICRIN
jgi:hypothetical protein